MKRKRGSKTGHKKGRQNGLSAVNDPASTPVSANTQDNSDQNDDGRMDSEMDFDLPPVGSDKPSKISGIDADLPNDRSSGKGGPVSVKVKLRSSRVPKPHKSHSDTETPSDTARSNPPAMELNDMAMEKEDATCSDGQTSGMQATLSEKIPRNAGSIKIKSSRGLDFSNDIVQAKNLNELNTPPRILSDGRLPLLDIEKAAHSSVPRNLCQRETTVRYRDPHYNEKELSAALEVIKKVMKMDAAGPFNAPVNPVALGIPDYFDVIDNPMDFGTICHDLENGCKYMNSKDIYKDVQFIWDNCYRYNNKGDYIIDLMKRVKKNFMKSWMAAGLYYDMPGSLGATEGTQAGDAVRSGQDKLNPKSKSKHRRYGIDRHKSDCMCAVCVVRRRIKEHDGNHVPIGDAGLSQEFKLEERSPVDNPCHGDATSSLDCSAETDANANVGETEIEEKLETPDSAKAEQQDILDNEMELNHRASSKSDPPQKLPVENGAQENSIRQPGDWKVDRAVQVQALAYDLQQMENKQRDSSESSRHFKLQENNLLRENRSILQICQNLFPCDRKSMWNGPRSLRRRYRPVGDCPIHAAVASFMKQ